MENHFFDSRMCLQNPLTSIGALLIRFAECSQFTFSAKDIQTRRIFINNKACSELYGLAERGLVGMTSRDCLEQVKPFVQREDVLKRWEQEEIKAITHNGVQTTIITTLDYEGFVRIRQHLTMPVHGEKTQLVGIAAFCYDRTNHINFLSLFKQYQQYYAKNQATTQLSKYLKLNECFQFRLTTGELNTLLALVQVSRHKQAASLLSAFRKKNITPRTIAGYVDSMKEKLKPHLNLETVLSNLRGFNQWTPDPDIF